MLNILQKLSERIDLEKIAAVDATALMQHTKYLARMAKKIPENAPKSAKVVSAFIKSKQPVKSSKWRFYTSGHGVI